MTQTIQKLLDMRPKVQELLDALGALKYERPAPLTPEEEKGIRQAASTVRQTRQAIGNAENVVAQCEAACRKLAAGGASDTELKNARTELCDAREAVEFAVLRAQGAVENQSGVVARVRRDAEARRDNRRTVCHNVAFETGRPHVIDANRTEGTLGRLVHQLYEQLENHASSYRVETIHSDSREVDHAISGLVERVTFKQAMEAPLP